MLALNVRHVTSYRYANPVELGEHRMMLRPRDSHDLRVVQAKLSITPRAELRWVHDVFGNSITFATFQNRATELRIESELDLVRYPPDVVQLAVDSSAASYPFIYSADDRTDLGRLLERHYPDQRGAVGDWAQDFVRRAGPGTMDILYAMNGAFKNQFMYMMRHEEGTQAPTETLQREAVLPRLCAADDGGARVLGFGARFVTGYLYDPALDVGGAGMVGSGQPMPGWKCTSRAPDGWSSIRPTTPSGPTRSSGSPPRATRARRSRSQGQFIGSTTDPLGMSVDVTVTAGIFVGG